LKKRVVSLLFYLGEGRGERVEGRGERERERGEIASS
jgi:hypothetical protein